MLVYKYTLRLLSKHNGSLFDTNPTILFQVDIYFTLLVDMSQAVWLVTGSTSGIGAALVHHILARGDRVIASGRNIEDKLGNLRSENVALLELDVTAGLETLRHQITKAWDIFGHIDVWMNNAGMSAMRTVEDAK